MRALFEQHEESSAKEVSFTEAAALAQATHAIREAVHHSTSFALSCCSKVIALLTNKGRLPSLTATHTSAAHQSGGSPCAGQWEEEICDRTSRTYQQSAYRTCTQSLQSKAPAAKAQQECECPQIAGRRTSRKGYPNARRTPTGLV